MSEQLFVVTSVVRGQKLELFRFDCKLAGSYRALQNKEKTTALCS